VNLFYNCHHLLCLRVRLKQAFAQPQSAGCSEQCHTRQQTQLSSQGAILRHRTQITTIPSNTRMYSRYNACSAFIISVCFTLKLWLFSRPVIVVNLQFMVNVKLFSSFLQNLLLEFFVMLLNWWRLVYKTNTEFGGHVFPFLLILFCFNGVQKN